MAVRTAVDDAEITAHLRWADGERTWRWRGDLPADACERVGTVQIVVPEVVGPLTLDLALGWTDGSADNRYEARITGA